MNKEYPLSFHEINTNPEERIYKLKHEPAPIVLLLDGLKDPDNLGSMFRLADAACIAGIYGYKVNIKPKQSKIERISRNTLKNISYTQLDSIEDVQALAKDYHPIALEYTNKSIPFNGYRNESPCMLVVGSEQTGVSGELLSICKTSLHIPMLGFNSSMNVSVATGIVLYHLLGNMKRI